MSECVEWPRARTAGGYGALRVGAKVEYAHRKAWADAHGPHGPGLCVLHRCDNRACVNVEHLFLGTDADNTADMWSKGRAWQQRNPRLASRGERHHKAKLSDAQVREIREAVSGGATRKAVAARLGVHPTTVGDIVARKSRAG